MPSNGLPPPVVEHSLSDFDLAKLRGNPLDTSEVTGSRPCSANTTGEIVVCARSNRSNRLRALPDAFRMPEILPRAEVQLGSGMRLDAHGEAAALAGGVQSNRIMVTISHKF